MRLRAPTRRHGRPLGAAILPHSRAVERKVRRTVLLVEPDKATRRLYAREIARLWRVVEAADLAEARTLLDVQGYAAVIFEPYAATPAADDGDALEAAWQFMRRGLMLRPSVPFVVCSVLDERRAAYTLGASLYLLKPVAPQTLVGELQRLLGEPAA